MWLKNQLHQDGPLKARCGWDVKDKKPKMEYCTKSSNNSLNSKGQLLCAVCNNSCRMNLFFCQIPICLGPGHRSDSRIQQMLHLYVQLYITRVSAVIQFTFFYIAPFTIKNCLWAPIINTTFHWTCSVWFARRHTHAFCMSVKNEHTSHRSDFSVENTATWALLSSEKDNDARGCIITMFKTASGHTKEKIRPCGLILGITALQENHCKFSLLKFTQPINQTIQQKERCQATSEAQQPYKLI